MCTTPLGLPVVPLRCRQVTNSVKICAEEESERESWGSHRITVEGEGYLVYSMRAGSSSIPWSSKTWGSSSSTGKGSAGISSGRGMSGMRSSSAAPRQRRQSQLRQLSGLTGNWRKLSVKVRVHECSVGLRVLEEVPPFLRGVLLGCAERQPSRKQARNSNVTDQTSSTMARALSLFMNVQCDMSEHHRACDTPASQQAEGREKQSIV